MLLTSAGDFVNLLSLGRRSASRCDPANARGPPCGVFAPIRAWPPDGGFFLP